MTKKRKWLIAIVIVLPIIIVGLSGGCASTSLPPKLTKAQLDEIAKTHFAVTVGVEDFKYPVYSEKLTKALQRTGLFDKVEPIKSFKEPPAYVARVERTIYGTAAIPILTGLSFGLIPTTVQEEHGHSFSLTATEGSNRKIPIEFSHRGPTTLGWWAVILNMLPNRTSGDVYKHARFNQSFAWTVVSHKSEIAPEISPEANLRIETGAKNR
ncbi:MAG: hypothetical protein EPN25_08190 [Nitrospirae bacterium]|nr:MAG: hypothetical protein EPN25_08190 [Nitrospirota bacterium]